MNKTFIKAKILAGAVVTGALLLSGCGDSENFVFTNTVAPVVINAPVAVNDAYSALGNSTVNFTAANGVLANDTLNGGVIDSFDAVGTQGGALVLNADGSLSYTPVFGFVGSETFAYSLRNAGGTSTATITFTSTGSGFFVNNEAADGGNGSQAAPFDTLAEAIAAASSGDTIFVARGDGTSTGLTGAVTLPQGVDLIGEGQGLVVSQTIVPQGLAPVLNGPLTCQGDNTVSGLTFDGQNTTSELVIVSGAADVTISNNTFRNAVFEYIDCDNVTGTTTIDNNQFDPGNSMSQYIGVDNVDTNGNVTITNNVFDDNNTADPDCEGVEFDVEGTSVMSVIVSGNAFNGSNDGNSLTQGVEIDTENTSAVTFTVEMNTCTGLDDDLVDFASSGASTLSGSITGNMISNMGENGIEVEANGGTTTISNNIIDTVGNDGIGIDFSLGGTIIVSANQISNAGGDGIYYFDSTSTNPALLGIRDNTITDSDDESIDINIDGSPSVCVDLTGNTVNDDMRFEDTSSGALQVEDFGNIMTINTFNNMSTTQEVGGGVTSVPDGDCNIP